MSSFVYLALVSSVLFVYCSTAVSELKFGNVSIWLYSPDVIRVTHLANEVYSLPTGNSSRIVNYVANDDIEFTVSTENETINIDTAALRVSINNNKSLVSFYDISDISTPLLSEISTVFIPVTDSVLKTTTYEVLQEWEYSASTTALFGFGEYQNGFLNYENARIRCVQSNTEACVPMFISNAGYGILWDNYGVTEWNSKTILIANNV